MKITQTFWSRNAALLLFLVAVLLAAGAAAVRGREAADSFDPNANGPVGVGASGSWTATGSLNTAREFHTATLLPNGKVLVAGGENGPLLTSVELYDPASGSWTATGSLNTAREFHTATLLPNGLVLVAGGFGLTSAELYDPASASWTATGSLNTARYFHTATLLPNGLVLVAGGYNNSDRYLTSAERFDQASGSWTPTGSLNTARYFHTATLLPNGLVLVAGGYNNSDRYLTSAELYAPTQESGNFVIGDVDAAVGGRVYFWGSQWAAHNHLSQSSAPSAFKGFANSIGESAPICGGVWRSDPGNSSGPPSTVPTFITVIASSSITKAGPVITGNNRKIVVVRTDPGYEGNPSHPGTGTVMSVTCQ